MTAAPTKELVSGAGWLTASTLVVGALNYGYALTLTHLLPADRYAQFAAAQALLLTAGTMLPRPSPGFFPSNWPRTPPTSP